MLNEIKNQIIDGITSQVLDEVKDKSREEIIELLVSSQIEQHLMKEYNRIIRNAVFTAKREHIMVPMFSGENLEPTDPEKWIVDYRYKQLKSGEITEEYYDEKVAQIENRIKKLEADKAKAKAEAEAVKAASTPVNPDSSQKKSKKTREADEVVTFTAEESVCPVCGSAMCHAGYHSRKKFVYKPGKLTVVEEKLETVVCPHHCMDENGNSIIQTASAPYPDLIDKSPATESLVAGIAFEKFILATPVYRLEKYFRTFGVDLSRQTMSNMLLYC